MRVLLLLLLLKEHNLARTQQSLTAIDALISEAAKSLPLGYELRPEQRQSLQKFVAGNDVFISLPTGFGKSLCYILLPSIFDMQRK